MMKLKNLKKHKKIYHYHKLISHKKNKKMNKMLKKFKKKLVCVTFFIDVFLCIFGAESCQKLAQSLSQHKKMFNENLKQITKSSQNFSKSQFPEAFEILKKGKFKKFHKNSKNLFSDEFLKENNKEMEDAEDEIRETIENLTQQENTLQKHIQNFDKQLGLFF